MSLNTTPRTWVSGEVVTAAHMNTEVRDALTGIQAAWTAYTPTWTAATTNPVLGNGTAVGSYMRIGKTIHFRITITMGTTTTYGSGQYSIGLPVQAHATGLQFLPGEATIAGGANRAVGRISPGASTALLYCDPTTAGSTLRAVTPTIPATFANGSILTICGTYEAA